jgi:2,4-diaminopentanoate dehydrogenase
MTRLLVVGAGQIGAAAAAAALEDGVVDALAGVVDPDPAAASGLGGAYGAPVYTSTHEVPQARSGDRALVAISPRVDVVAPEILRLVSLGYSVVSTCEELAWPPRHMWNALHTAARTHGKVIVMTGVNPGFVMDRLPLLAAAACRNVKSLTVSRRIDSSARRESFIPKTGRGLSAAEWHSAVAAGTVGHRGLVPSAHLLGHALNWPNRDVTDSLSPIIDGDAVSGFRQHVTLRAGDKTIDLDFVVDWGLERPGDRIVVDGEPPLELEIAGGYHGDLGAAAQVVMALEHCGELTPSFYRPTDLPLRFG